jgi:DNA polymerase III gamma/tau subunit
MNNIIKEEKLEITTDAKEYLIHISNNSIRRFINNLEKIYIIGEKVDLELCKKLCSSISIEQFEKYIDEIRNKNLDKAIKILYGIYDYGYSVIDILDYFFSFVKTTDSLNEHEKYKMIPMLCKYITIFHNVHEDVIELALFTNNINNII